MPLPDAFHDLARAVNNWGRWGPDDQLGTLNFLTDEVVHRAASAVRSGRRFSLAMPLGPDGPQAGLVPGRDNPVHSMIAINEPLSGDPTAFATSDDRLDIALQCATHWDALAHVTYDGRMYNGFDPAASITEAGASACGIDRVQTLVGRAVLLDVPRALGVERLEGGHALSVADLEASEAMANVEVGRGDIVLVRTGQVQHYLAGDRIAYAFPSAGPSMQTVPWFHEREVAAVATDTITFEVFPGELDGVFLPVHLLHLVEMGLTQGQNFDLEALAADCANDGQYTMLLEASPQPVVGGLGSPVNPVAIK